MEDTCPECGSLDVMEDLLKKRTLVCNDCGHIFPMPEYKKEDTYEHW